MNRLADFCCPNCGGTLDAGRAIVCASCAMQYPLKFGVPVLVKGASASKRGEKPTPEFVAAMASFLDTPREESKHQIEDCYCLRYDFGSKILQTEADQFLNRLKSSGIVLPSPYSQDKKPEQTIELQTGHVNLKWLVLPERVKPGKLFTLTVIISNGTNEPLRSGASEPFLLSYRIVGRSLKHKVVSWLRRREIYALRTSLLIDLGPGHQIANPIYLMAPDEPGQYTISVMPVIEGVRWMEEAQITCSLEISDDQPDYLEVEWTADPKSRGPANDHARGQELLVEWMEKYVPSRLPRILELGGNFNPCSKILRHGNIFNVDIDPFGLMTFNIQAESNGGVNFRNVVADGMNLPFANGFFDMVMMFATFHHFPDPIGLLKHLHTKIGLDGMVFLMCEPIGHVFVEREDSAEFISELERGVYEQSFMPWEYRKMIELSNFEVVAAALDHGSLKIAARRK